MSSYTAIMHSWPKGCHFLLTTAYDESLLTMTYLIVPLDSLVGGLKI